MQTGVDGCGAFRQHFQLQVSHGIHHHVYCVNILFNPACCTYARACKSPCLVVTTIQIALFYCEYILQRAATHTVGWQYVDGTVEHHGENVPLYFNTVPKGVCRTLATTYEIDDHQRSGVQCLCGV